MPGGSEEIMLLDDLAFAGGELEQTGIHFVMKNSAACLTEKLPSRNGLFVVVSSSKVVETSPLGMGICEIDVISMSSSLSDSRRLARV